MHQPQTFLSIIRLNWISFCNSFTLAWSAFLWSFPKADHKPNSAREFIIALTFDIVLSLLGSCMGPQVGNENFTSNIRLEGLQNYYMKQKKTMKQQTCTSLPH